ncbi:unnamed protein product, partial [Rotaria sordida]
YNPMGTNNDLITDKFKFIMEHVHDMFEKNDFVAIKNSVSGPGLYEIISQTSTGRYYYDNITIQVHARRKKNDIFLTGLGQLIMG